MVYKGYKIQKEGFTLEITKIEKITDDIESINYVVKKGNDEITDGFIFVTKNDNKDAKLKEVFDSIVRAIKRVS